MKKIAQAMMAIALMGLTLMIVGCHTANGFGQDVQASGKAIQTAANS